MASTTRRERRLDSAWMAVRALATALLLVVLAGCVPERTGASSRATPAAVVLPAAAAGDVTNELSEDEQRAVDTREADQLAAEARARPQTRGDATGKPNVLIILTDDQQVNLFTRELMPNVFSEIVDRGVNFQRAYTNQSECCPARASLLTGLFAHHTGVDTNEEPLLRAELARPTFVQALQIAGYHTMLAGKYLNSESCLPRPGWDEWVCGDFWDRPNPRLRVGEEQIDERASVDAIADHVVDFLQRQQDPAAPPFFVLYAPHSPHLPAQGGQRGPLPDFYDAPSFDEATEGTDKPEYTLLPPMSEDQQESMRDNFHDMARAVTDLDDAVGRMLAALGPRANDTLVIFLTDNGYLYGEHRLTAKGAPYEESTRIPFAVRPPSTVSPAQARSTEALASIVDVAPTIMDLAGVPWAADGHSLLPILSGRADAVQDAVLVELCQAGNGPCSARDPEDPPGRDVPPFWGLKTDEYAYTEYATGERELYDLSSDPYELHNLANLETFAAVRANLATRLRELRGDPAVPDTTLAVGPVGNANPSSVAFEVFTASPGATLECALDGQGQTGAWVPCATGRATFRNLQPGQYVFRARAVSAAGVPDPSPALRSFGVA
jgi:arylsulfatase A-like enzyme